MIIFSHWLDMSTYSNLRNENQAKSITTGDNDFQSFAIRVYIQQLKKNRESSKIHYCWRKKSCTTWCHFCFWSSRSPFNIGACHVHSQVGSVAKNPAPVACSPSTLKREREVNLLYRRKAIEQQVVQDFFHQPTEDNDFQSFAIRVLCHVCLNVVGIK